jgi:hypothetical protein
MKSIICSVCHQYCAGDYVKFADFQPLLPGYAGNPKGYECFCQAHLPMAQWLAHLTAQQAISIIIQNEQRVPHECFPKKSSESQTTVVFEQQKGRAAASATFLMLFSIAMVCFPILLLIIFLNDLKLRSSGIQFSQVLIFLGLSLTGLAGAAILGYSSYCGFKLAHSKKPRLTLDAEGFFDLKLGDERIYWKDIKTVKFVQRRVRRTGVTISSIKMLLNEDSEFKQNTFVLKSILRKIMFGGYDLEILVSFLNEPALNVFANFEYFRQNFAQ